MSPNNKPDFVNPIPAEGEEMRVVKGNEIIEGFDKELEIPKDSKLNDLYRLLIWKIRDEDGNNIGWEAISFPENVESQFFGLSKVDLEAIAGRGGFIVRLWDKRQQDWAKGYSKTFYIGVSKDKPKHRIVDETPEPQPDEDKEEEEVMNDFTKNLLEKNERKIETLEAEVKTLTTQLNDSKMAAEAEKNKALTIGLQKDEADKRFQSEKSALEREKEKAKDDLEKEKEKVAEKSIATEKDYRTTLETKSKELADLKEKINELVRDKEKFQFESLLAKAKEGDGSSAVTIKALESITGMKMKQMEMGSSQQTESAKMLWEFLMRQLDIQAESDAITAEANANALSPTPVTDGESVTQKLGLPKLDQILAGAYEPINKFLQKAGLTLIHQDEVDKQIKVAREDGLKEGAKLGVERTAKQLQDRIRKAKEEGIQIGKGAVKVEIAKVKTDEAPPKSEDKKPKKK